MAKYNLFQIKAIPLKTGKNRRGWEITLPLLCYHSILLHLLLQMEAIASGQTLRYGKILCYKLKRKMPLFRGILPLLVKW